jgi:hypothetical protein
VAKTRPAIELAAEHIGGARQYNGACIPWSNLRFDGSPPEDDSGAHAIVLKQVSSANSIPARLAYEVLHAAVPLQSASICDPYPELGGICCSYSLSMSRTPRRRVSFPSFYDASPKPQVHAGLKLLQQSIYRSRPTSPKRKTAHLSMLLPLPYYPPVPAPVTTSLQTLQAQVNEIEGGEGWLCIRR